MPKLAPVMTAAGEVTGIIEVVDMVVEGKKGIRLPHNSYMPVTIRPFFAKGYLDRFGYNLQ